MSASNTVLDSQPLVPGTRRVMGFAEPDGGWLVPAADGLSVSPYVCLAERSTGGHHRAAGPASRNRHI
jgi:hypothetical protein